jgi:hypothetical protein
VAGGAERLHETVAADVLAWTCGLRPVHRARLDLVKGILAHGSLLSSEHMREFT